MEILKVVLGVVFYYFMWLLGFFIIQYLLLGWIIKGEKKQKEYEEQIIREARYKDRWCEMLESNCDMGDPKSVEEMQQARSEKEYEYSLFCELQRDRLADLKWMRIIYWCLFFGICLWYIWQILKIIFLACWAFIKAFIIYLLSQD